ncbi:helix-turn-helix domain-containing protein [Pseudooceanicola nanhaiensis]|jgi:transcriptional regulator with XRE-family HTH domain|uniref:XRE family transcriptional regulator n=1 Tax=Pseudooceanicola nanhaiensis TaxID=375761 RepID=A0A917WIJ1_9RHOB|nr:XRE family transcriptional regulator [Pseudooceanicola nanhaiensis]GGM07610.1 XRE family transcriptional regulator [Pseudooceanicola nanhaiensis]
MSAETTDLTGRARMASRLRRLREARGLTIQAVADRGGIAISTVSKIERNLMAPTYDRFTRLARGLGVDVAELFADESSRFETGGVAVARRGEFGYHETENYSYEMLFPQVRGKAMVPMMGTLKPLEQMRFDRMVSHGGEEFLLVLEGRVIVQLADRDDVLLDQGDSLYFDSGRGHLYASALDAPARILVVCTQPDAARDQP